MYKTDFICNYKDHDTMDQEHMYQIQLLQSFNLNKWEDETINDIMDKLFNDLKKNKELINIINVARKSEKLTTIKQFIGDDDFTIFKGLFQYDLFHLIHLCICDLVNLKEIRTFNKENLINNL